MPYSVQLTSLLGRPPDPWAWTLTTIADHDDIRHSPIERVTREAKFPGWVRFDQGEGAWRL